MDGISHFPYHNNSPPPSLILAIIPATYLSPFAPSVHLAKIGYGRCSPDYNASLAAANAKFTQ